MISKKSICFVATVEYAVNAFLFNHLVELSKYYKITVITKQENKGFQHKVSEEIDFINLDFKRKINLVSDLIVFFKLFIIFFKNRFDVVTTITPKAGLLGMLASYIAFTPMRVHCYTGQIWITRLGFQRRLFRSIDKFINALSTHNIIDSKSQYDFLLNEHIIFKDKSFVFGGGSVCGVDLKRFKPNTKVKFNLRKKLKIPQSAFVFLFLGRLNKDKGIDSLINAFKKSNLETTYLLVVGPDEEGIVLKYKKSKNIIFQGFCINPQDYMAASDMLCLPSFREGFGSVVIEAAATGVPSMVIDIYGLSDSVIPNKTGIIHKVNDINGMVRLFKIIIEDKKFVKNLGKEARLRATKEFDSNLITSYWKTFYEIEISKLIVD